MTEARGRRDTVAVSVDRGRRLVLDHSCGTCLTCEAGWPIWCQTQIEIGRELCSYPAGIGADEVLAALMILSALVAANLPPADVVLAITLGSTVGLGTLIKLVHPGPVLSTSDPRATSVKTALAQLTSTGRADAVISTHSVRDAVRAVSRGGCVCLAHTVVGSTTVTELVQREVRLVGPKDLRQAVSKAGRVSLEAALKAA